jgi:uncharacterized protein (DUF1810 family)
MSAMDDPFDLKRFVHAQIADYGTAVSELRAGRKRSHWMWYIFPQLRGLGSSSMADLYAISSLEEAQAYLRHPLLGPRLRESTELANQAGARKAEEVFPYPDNLKFRSSVTLFSRATEDNSVFHRALEKYFAGIPDPLTLDLLRQMEE